MHTTAPIVGSFRAVWWNAFWESSWIAFPWKYPLCIGSRAGPWWWWLRQRRLASRRDKL